MRLIDSPGGGAPCIAFSARQFGVNRERLDRAWEAGEPIDPADPNLWIVRRVVARDDGSADYFVSNRYGGRACILVHAPRPAAPYAPASAMLAPEEYAESGLSAKFLDVLFRASLVEGKPAFYRDWLVAIDGDSRPPGGRVSWFLTRKGDDRRLVVRLDLPTATLPTATLPTATLPTATLPTATLPTATPPPARRKSRPAEQPPMFACFAGGDDGPYRTKGGA